VEPMYCVFIDGSHGTRKGREKSHYYIHCRRSAGSLVHQMGESLTSSWLPLWMKMWRDDCGRENRREESPIKMEAGEDVDIILYGQPVRGLTAMSVWWTRRYLEAGGGPVKEFQGRRRPCRIAGRTC
jgi:hypothetical protein